MAKRKKERLWTGILFLVLVLVGSGGAVWYFYNQIDNIDAIKTSENNLLQIWRGIREFQSEGYFARAPKKMEELFHYRFTSYIPKPRPNPDQPSPGFSPTEREYSLIPDLLVFTSPNHDRSSEKGAFASDYSLLSWYEKFLPDEAVIAWDNPGNFRSGGNLLFYGGKVKFYKMQPQEYQRLIKALQTKTDREFVRKQCREASVAGFRKDPADD